MEKKKSSGNPSKFSRKFGVAYIYKYKCTRIYVKYVYCACVFLCGNILYIFGNRFAVLIAWDLPCLLIFKFHSPGFFSNFVLLGRDFLQNLVIAIKLSNSNVEHVLCVRVQKLCELVVKCKIGYEATTIQHHRLNMNIEHLCRILSHREKKEKKKESVISLRSYLIF